MSATTVAKGMREIQSGETIKAGRVRRAGGGRRPLTETDPTLLKVVGAASGHAGIVKASCVEGAGGARF